jgi:hypothetical protein
MIQLSTKCSKRSLALKIFDQNIVLIFLVCLRVPCYVSHISSSIWFYYPRIYEETTNTKISILKCALNPRQFFSVWFKCPERAISKCPWPIFFTGRETKFHIYINKEFWKEQSQSQSYVTTDSQSASLSWWQAPIWGLRPNFYYCQTVAGLLMWGALPDERTGLPFTIAAGPRQRSHSWIRVPRDS